MKAVKLAITMGDPCGIGPEIICKTFLDDNLVEMVNPVVVGEEKALDKYIENHNLPLKTVKLRGTEQEKGGKMLIPVINPFPYLNSEDIIPANPSAKTARATIKYIEEAVFLALEGQVDAVCTAPINKAVLQAHGFPFPGHTEFIQYLTRSSKVVMMLAGSILKVTLVTIHEPLHRVSSLLTKERIIETIEITASAMEKLFQLEKPRIAVCGLNPHGGEEGRFGEEEITVIAPAIKAFKNSEKWQISGPHPPDTVFYKAKNGLFDVVVSMYHDQGLIPFKLLHFEDGVNVTLGLPVIRTSVDHGTAYDIAGKGIGNPESLKSAIKLAYQMVLSRKTYEKNSLHSSPRGQN